MNLLIRLLIKTYEIKLITSKGSNPGVRVLDIYTKPNEPQQIRDVTPETKTNIWQALSAHLH